MDDYDEETYENDEREAEDSPNATNHAGLRRAWILLLIVLILGLLLLGLFVVIRPEPLPMPTMKPPWLV